MLDKIVPPETVFSTTPWLFSWAQYFTELVGANWPGLMLLVAVLSWVVSKTKGKKDDAAVGKFSRALSWIRGGGFLAFLAKNQTGGGGADKPAKTPGGVPAQTMNKFNGTIPRSGD